MKKKNQYHAPKTEAFQLCISNHILEGSDDGGMGEGGELEAPGLFLDDNFSLFDSIF